jgi:predicted glycosyltransferase
VLLWVQHLVGVGHQRRSAALARALAQAGARVCYVSGGMPVADLDLAGCALEQLPPARSLDMRYHTLVDGNGEPVDGRWREARAARLQAALQAFRPDAVCGPRRC